MTKIAPARANSSPETSRPRCARLLVVECLARARNLFHDAEAVERENA